MKKLFENVGGNRFRLLTESIDNGLDKTKLVREGLKKVFSTGGPVLSYKKLSGVGLGYIKDVSEAKKTAIQEARVLAKEYGYMDDENQQKFVKQEAHDETDMNNPEEKREVQIGKRIIEIVRHMKPLTMEDNANEIEQLASELIQMHGAQ